MSQTECRVTVIDWDPLAPVEFVNTIGFTYANDVQNIGDVFSFTIANFNGRYRDDFQIGSEVKFYLTNPDVNGGRRTLKHLGIITRRTIRADASGCFLDIECSDKGWHLRENCAPPWYHLQGARLDKVLRDPEFIDPSWGIKGPEYDNSGARALRLDLNLGRAGAQLQTQALVPFAYVQVEPGDRVADIITNYARREGVLFTVGPDAVMRLWNPDFTQKPLYTLNCYPYSDSRRTQNNVISSNYTREASQLFTDVICIGEIVGTDLTQDPEDQNAAKRLGSFPNPQTTGYKAPLPFKHLQALSDGDIFSEASANRMAEWRYQRSLFDSWVVTYTVKGHHQNGSWWEADTMCTVHDQVLGIDGDFYVSSVLYTRDATQGDRTQLTLRLPVLSASFGPLPRACLLSGGSIFPK